jgi:hypothetical protein
MSVDPFFQNNQEDIEEAMRRFAPKPPRPILDTRTLFRSMGDVVLQYESRLREDPRTWTNSSDVRRKRTQRKTNRMIRERAHKKMLEHAAKTASEAAKTQRLAKLGGTSRHRR